MICGNLIVSFDRMDLWDSAMNLVSARFLWVSSEDYSSVSWAIVLPVLYNHERFVLDFCLMQS